MINIEINMILIMNESFSMHDKIIHCDKTLIFSETSNM